MSEILLVSLGTTQGLRIADALLLDMLAEAGAEARAVGVRIGATDALRRGYPVNDVVEAIASRRALAGALRADAARGWAGMPDALIFSTTTAAFLADPALPYAVRLDSPAALNRPGARNAPVRALERRSLARARLVIPSSRAAAAALPAGSAPSAVVPVPIEPSGAIDGPREDGLCVAYTPDPKAKGLDLLSDAWAGVARAGRRLVVFGISEIAGAAFLARRGRTAPPGLAFRGFVTPEDFRATLRRARCFISAARWEDFGQAPLEALCDGALLVTAPAGGAYEALPIARELAPSLVAEGLSPGSLSGAIEAAFALGEAEVERYREEAQARLAPYRRAAAVEVLRQEVLPALSG